MAYEYIVYRKVEFSETDMAGLVHFSNYFRYMEIAERDFFESINVKLIQSIPYDLIGFPRSRAECKFSAPLRFGDTVKVHLAIKTIKDRAIDYQFRLYKLASSNAANKGEKDVIPVAKGHLTTIYTELTDDGSLQSKPLPKNILERIEEAPESVLRPEYSE